MPGTKKEIKTFVFISFLVLPSGFEPKPSEPESDILSIRLWEHKCKNALHLHCRLYKVSKNLIKHCIFSLFSKILLNFAPIRVYCILMLETIVILY